ncbi:Gll0821 protein [alpha proteobacterium U9-1i]|nr:Gll0821 protein [alpha proteobacterium U9-1i]
MRVVAAALALFCAGFAAPDRVEYTLRPEMLDGAMRALGVSLTFTGDADGETVLELPSSWGGEEELWRGVDDLRAGDGASLGAGAGPQFRVLRYAPGARVSVSYRIIQDGEGPPVSQGRGRYRPVIQPRYFHLIGETALVVPDVDEGRPARVRVSGLPRGWRYASDLQHGGLAVANLRASVMVGGDFRVLNAPNGHARVAIRGAWSFTDRDFAREAGEIIGAQRAFWGDERQPFLVTVLQQEAAPGNRSVGGTGLSDAFAFFATPNADAGMITRTLAHEGNHTWIPGQIGGFPRDETLERGSYWLSEGFTEFFTGRLLVRQGVWGPAEFAADLNSMLDAYAQSSANTAPNARVIADFWSDNEVQRLPYRRGRLLATIWDARLRAEGRSLDAVLRAMRARARAGDPRTAGEMFLQVAREFGVDTAADLTTYEEQGALVRLSEDVFAPCGHVLTEDAPRFHRGFDIDATSANNNVIAGVDPTLNAYAAGVRDGMVLLRRDAGEIGNANVELVYVMRDGDAERTFRYLPRGHGAFTRQRFEIAPVLEGEALSQCRAVLAGN